MFAVVVLMLAATAITGTRAAAAVTRSALTA